MKKKTILCMLTAAMLAAVCAMSIGCGDKTAPSAASAGGDYAGEIRNRTIPK